MVKLIFKTSFCLTKNKKKYNFSSKKIPFFSHILRQNLKIILLSHKNEKNKHSDVKNVSFF